METATENKKIDIKDIIDETRFAGKWKLHYEVTNRAGINAFGGFTLAPYVHPLNQMMCYPVIDGQQVDFLPFNKVDSYFSPMDNRNDRAAVAWLLTHPEVNIPGLKMSEKIKNSKQGSSNLTLVNLDLQNLQAIDDENTIDQAIVNITLPGTNPAGLSLEKIRWVCAKLGVKFRDRRYMTSAMTEDKLLRQKLKNFVRESVDNAIQFDRVVNDLQTAKKNYIVQILLEKNILQVFDGIIKYKEYILGGSIQMVVEKMMVDQELALELEKETQKVLKEEKKGN